MPPRTKTLSDAAKAALAAATITDDLLVLPGTPGQPDALPKTVYTEVNTALTRLGARWDRRRRGHVFTGDIREALATVLDDGTMPRDAAKDAGFWPTPEPVAQRLVRRVLIHLGDAPKRILEPSAGEGHLARVLRDRFPLAHITCVEPDWNRSNKLAEDGFGNHEPIRACTIEQYVAADVGREWWGPHDAVVMNPPFSLAGHPRAWAEHVLLLWDSEQLLAPGGILVAVVPSSITSGRDRLTTRVRQLAARHGGIEGVEDGAFKESGTGVSTSILWLARAS